MQAGSFRRASLAASKTLSFLPRARTTVRDSVLRAGRAAVIQRGFQAGFRSRVPLPDAGSHVPVRCIATAHLATASFLLVVFKCTGFHPIRFTVFYRSAIGRLERARMLLHRIDQAWG